MLKFHFDRIFALLLLGCFLLNIGCSIGSMLVQVPPATPTSMRTRRPTYTPSPVWTLTFTPSSTPTPTKTFTPTPTPTRTSTPTVTPTPVPTDTPKPEPAEESAPPQPAQPVSTPTPSAPTATATPAFPFMGIAAIHNTGSPSEVRFTGWIRVDYQPGKFKTLADFQMKVLAPDGKTYFSERSGSGSTDSTVAGTGDNHRMNTKLEIRPYLPGKYQVWLVQGETQVSAIIDITLSTSPLQYVHIDFSKKE